MVPIQFLTAPIIVQETFREAIGIRISRFEADQGKWSLRFKIKKADFNFWSESADFVRKTFKPDSKIIRFLMDPEINGQTIPGKLILSCYNW